MTNTTDEEKKVSLSYFAAHLSPLFKRFLEKFLNNLKNRFAIVGGNIRYLLKDSTTKELKGMVKDAIQRLVPADVNAFNELDIKSMSTPSICYSVHLNEQDPGELSLLFLDLLIL